MKWKLLKKLRKEAKKNHYLIYRGSLHYLLVYNTKNLKKVIELDTNNINIANIILKEVRTSYIFQEIKKRKELINLKTKTNEKN